MNSNYVNKCRSTADYIYMFWKCVKISQFWIFYTPSSGALSVHPSVSMCLFSNMCILPPCDYSRGTSCLWTHFFFCTYWLNMCLNTNSLCFTTHTQYRVFVLHIRMKAFCTIWKGDTKSNQPFLIILENSNWC